MSTELLPVTFYGDTLFLTEHEGQPYLPIKPIADAMGLSWKSQYRKLVSDPAKWSVVTMTMVAADGRDREMICLPLRKLPAYLYNIDLKKVRPDRRPKVAQYQSECDEVLWDYWFKGHASNAPSMVIAPPEPETILLTKDEFLALQAKQITLLEIKAEYLELKARTQPRRRPFTDAEKREIQRLAATGLTPTQIGKRINRSESGVTAYLKRRINS